MLLLVEQQLEVLHEQQLEQLQDELHEPATASGATIMSIDGSRLSTTSNVAASSSSSSRLRDFMIHLSR